MSTDTRLDVYDLVTTRIIELLEQGTLPWQKPWANGGIPANLISKRAYRGVNLWLLLSLSYQQNFFLTWEQLKKIGGSVKQGEKGHVVIFWKMLPVGTTGEDEETSRPKALLRYYKVFNVTQCTNIPAEMIPAKVEKEHDPLLECEAIIKAMPQCPEIRHKQQRAFYHIVEDYVNMPRKKSFGSSESYYATLFHELVHSTGNEKRLNRKTVTEMNEFGSEPYSIEELVAEIGTCYLCNFTGILNMEINNSAAYINGWLEQLRKDKRFIVYASSFAQKAADFILNVQAPDLKGELEQQPELLIQE